jgi:hypothetical protein
MEHRWHPRHLPCKHRARRGLVRTGTRNQGSLPLIPGQIRPTRSENIKLSCRVRFVPLSDARGGSPGTGKEIHLKDEVGGGE